MKSITAVTDQSRIRQRIESKIYKQETAITNKTTLQWAKQHEKKEYRRKSKELVLVV